jgi:hypothetical protein
VRVFTQYPIGEYEDLSPVDEDDLDLFDEFDGTARSSGWTPVQMEIVSVDSESGAALQRADVPWFMGNLVLRDKAIAAATPILTPLGELLPLECVDAKLVCFNATRVLDVLDEDQSQIARFPSTGRIMAIEKYVFQLDAIPERAAFRIPQQMTGDVYFTEPVVEDLRGLGLTGLDFKLEWDSAQG